jgi:hypothetical protein
MAIAAAQSCGEIAFPQIMELYQAIVTLRETSHKSWHTPFIMRVAMSIQDASLTTKDRAEKAVGLWKDARAFVDGRERLAPTGRPRYIRNPYMEPSPDLDSDTEFSGAKKYQSAAGELNMTKATSLEKWLRLLMPTRKTADRLSRFRRCLLEMGGADSINEIDAEIQKWKQHPYFSDPYKYEYVLRSTTAKFIEWDEKTSLADLKKRNVSGGKARQAKK